MREERFPVTLGGERNYYEHELSTKIKELGPLESRLLELEGRLAKLNEKRKSWLGWSPYDKADYNTVIEELCPLRERVAQLRDTLQYYSEMLQALEILSIAGVPDAMSIAPDRVMYFPSQGELNHALKSEGHEIEGFLLLFPPARGVAGAAGRRSAGRAVARAAARDAAAVAEREATERAAQAACRFGLDPNSIKVADGIARARVRLLETLRFGDAATLKEYLRSQGAKKAILETGPVTNPELAKALRDAASSGSRFMGGTVRFVRELPSLVPDQKSVPEFEIIFGSL